jgi:hypothetical protein
MSTPVGKKREWHGAGEFDDDIEVVLKLAHDADSIIYVTKVTFSITTHANGKKLFVQDSTEMDTDTQTVIAAHTDATAGAGVLSVVTYDFGDWGIPIGAGLDLVAVSETAGPDGWFYAEGWEDIGDGTE